MSAQDKPPERPPRSIPSIVEMRNYSAPQSRPVRVWFWIRLALLVAILVAAGIVLLIFL
jgi:hypothetical protein